MRRLSARTAAIAAAAVALAVAGGSQAVTRSIAASPGVSSSPSSKRERVERKRALSAIRRARSRGRAARSVRPGVPRSLRQVDATTGSVTLDWEAPRSGAVAVRYGIYRGDTLVATAAYSNATIARLTCGQSSSYTVVAIGATGRRSSPAGPVSAATSACATATSSAPSPAAPPTATAAVASSSTPNLTLPGQPTFADVLRSDMSLLSELLPHGISYDFAYRPRLGAGADAGSYQAFTAWGQLYECSTGNPQPAARVEIRDIQAWVKSRASGAWNKVQQTARVDGSAFAESFVNNASKPADAYAIAGGGTSVTAGGGFNYHFWPQSTRVSIAPGDVGAVITSVRARLVSGSYGGGPAPCYVLSMGADYWSTASAAWNQFQTNADVGIGRFKRVNAAWRTYTMSTTSSGSLPTPAAQSPAEFG